MKYQVKDGVAWVILDRVERLNAFDEKSWEELGEKMRRANGDNNVKVVVLTGEGRAFSAGDDIYAMLELNSVEDAKRFFNTLFSAVESMMELEKPLICAVNGLAYGGGCEILLFCDIVIANKDSKFSIPEAKLGLIPPMAISVGHRLWGRAVTRLAITSDEITAEEAKQIGIVDYIVDDVVRKAEETSKKIIASVDLDSIRAIKRWSKADKEKVRRAIMELALLSLTSSAKRRMNDFKESHDKSKERKLK
ncbi:enoyl-CoA hydratase/isomerase family protein [Stygiolobus caldivivus]|uniref:Enoyl-CoA hydratase n=1 Tax=Stygiolobus caldivivus TaxID=2824673 RepID=A0A8D5U8M6_9CREN|nr:enoyl-CoA hydratase/isomerase family protein [Stygiolobus caldivivus]BCU70928.1 enoyl-CoA hydratase [Stygiolobus caldivivus]